MKPSTYNQLERKGNIKIDMLLKLSGIFGIDPQKFYLDIETPKPQIKAQVKKAVNKKEITLATWEANFLKVLNYIPSKKRTELLKLSILVMDNPRKIDIEQIVKSAEQIPDIKKTYSD